MKRSFLVIAILCVLLAPEYVLAQCTPPTPTITGTSSFCALTNNTFTTQAGQTNYIWPTASLIASGATIVSGGTSTSNSITLYWTAPTTTPLTVQYTNASGCSGTSS